MSQIKGANTKPELTVRRFLFRNGFRYRLHSKDLAGKPDIVLKRYKTVIFVHGCFWHGHSNCKYYTLPKTNTIWWEGKIKANTVRDKKNAESLEKEGWKIVTLWECQLKKQSIENTFISLLSVLKSNISTKFSLPPNE